VAGLKFEKSLKKPGQMSGQKLFFKHTCVPDSANPGQFSGQVQSGQIGVWTKGAKKVPVPFRNNGKFPRCIHWQCLACSQACLSSAHHSEQ
jgi:hypothetical protein